MLISKFEDDTGHLFKGVAYFTFFQIEVRFVVNFYHTYESVPQKSQIKGPVHLEELSNKTPSVSLDQLNKVGWALGNESADLYYYPLRRFFVSA